MDNDNPASPSDELVPFNSLKPSKEHFGPLPHGAEKPARGAKAGRPAAKAQKSQNGRATKGAAAKGAAQRPPSEGGVPALRRPPQPGPGVQGRKAAPGQPRQGQPAARSGKPASKGQGQGNSGRPQPRNLPARRPSAHNGEFANTLAAANRAPVTVPQSGWRSIVSKATVGTVNLAPSAAQQRELNLHKQVRRPVTDGTVAVFSRKGGVGKTTISAYLGLTLAAERGGRVVAVDGDAEAGSLGWLLAPEAPSTLAALAAADPMPADYSALRQYATTTSGGLDVIVGDPAEMGPVSTTGLQAVASQLARHYDLSIFDTGAGVTRATGRVLVNSARTLLLVMGPSVDSVRAAERTLAWLDERPDAIHPDARIVAVINGIPASTKKAHVDRIASHFSNRAAAVVRIPWDAHLAAGGTTVSLDLLAKPTRKAFLELAAATVGTLALPIRRPGYGGTRHAS